MHTNEFNIFPAERMQENFAWQIWLIGWLAIFKAFLWLAYEPNLSESTLRLLGYKYTFSLVPLVVCGIGIWNRRRWAAWGLVFIVAANLIFLIINPQMFGGFFVRSEVVIYSIVLSAVVFVCNGPLGDIFILIAAPLMLKKNLKYISADRTAPSS